ncbi:MAG: acylneuraminate cytidylyltransferase family protein [Pseudomonadota bacterium]
MVLSTDDEALAEEGRQVGAQVPFVRPAALATDTATAVDVARHALAALAVEEGYLVLLQPTSPLRTSEDIDTCIKACTRSSAGACVSVQEVDKTPYWMFTRGEDGVLRPFVEDRPIPSARQLAPPVYLLNGAVYVVDIGMFQKAGTFVPTGVSSHIMGQERSIDIDSAADLDAARRLVEKTSPAS